MCVVLRGCVARAEKVYVNVVKTKCLPILFYRIDCLRLDRRLVSKLNVVCTAFRWILGVSRYVLIRTYLRQSGTISFAFLIDLRFLLFMYRLKKCFGNLLKRLVT